ncbi:MAG: DUF1573 domain-containing protein [Fluviicola sp.]|nr:DUF1573 domain-containing protein [Fluviicola sp.]
MKVILLSISMLALSLSINAQEDVKKREAIEKKESIKEYKKIETEKVEVEKSEPKDAQTEKVIVFKNEVIERPEVKYDSQDLFIFEFKNTGKTPILIQNVQTSCGCTNAAKPEEPIQPGKKGEITVKYDTKRVGQFTKTITVTTNVQTEPIILTIKGTVLPQEVKTEEAPKN